MLALAAMAFWALPTLMLADAGVTRLFATQLLLLAGAAIVLTVDRHTESGAARSAPRTQRLARERLEARQLLAQGRLVEIANRQRPWVLQRWVR